MVYLPLRCYLTIIMGKAEKTRSYIIEKTAPIFNIKGYAGTSMNDITEATGLTKGSIYGNFKNKDEVALEVFEHNKKKMQNLFTLEISKKSTYKDKLLTYPELYEQFFSKHFIDGGCPIMNTAIEADDTHPLLKEAAKKAILVWKDSLMHLIQKGIDNKEFKPDTDPEETALLILSIIEGTVMVAKLTGKVNYLKTLMLSLRKLINEL
ncbi:HTH-type transcriptional regulator MtrR [compost metagenome]